MKGRQVIPTRFIDNFADAANFANGNLSADRKNTLLSSSIFADRHTGLKGFFFFKELSIHGISMLLWKKTIQPLFTTKPSGLGVGSSFPYDIIKAHGGELKVESENGNGTSLIIELPYKTNT